MRKWNRIKAQKRKAKKVLRNLTLWKTWSNLLVDVSWYVAAERVERTTPAPTHIFFVRVWNELISFLSRAVLHFRTADNSRPSYHSSVIVVSQPRYVPALQVNQIMFLLVALISTWVLPKFLTVLITLSYRFLINPSKSGDYALPF